MFNVGHLYESTGVHNSGADSSVDKDYQQAVTWYGKAATLGYTPAMFALASAYERGLGVERDLAQAASWYRKAADAGYTSAATKLQSLGASGQDSGSVPKVPVGKRKSPGPNFAGTWFEINSQSSAKPRRLVLQQDGAQVTFAGFQLTINQGGIATWTGPQSCEPQFQHSTYKYDKIGVAGTLTLKMSLDGAILIYENDTNWTAPCDGHPIGYDKDISRFRRVDTP